MEDSVRVSLLQGQVDAGDILTHGLLYSPETAKDLPPEIAGVAMMSERTFTSSGDVQGLFGIRRRWWT